MPELVARIGDRSERSRTDYVYSTSAYFNFGLMRAVPDTMVHAKVVGTTSTLCGIQCGSWRKFFDLPFRDATAPRCLRCSAATGMPG